MNSQTTRTVMPSLMQPCFGQINFFRTTYWCVSATEQFYGLHNRLEHIKQITLLSSGHKYPFRCHMRKGKELLSTVQDKPCPSWHFKRVFPQESKCRKIPAEKNLDFLLYCLKFIHNASMHTCTCLATHTPKEKMHFYPVYLACNVQLHSNKCAKQMMGKKVYFYSL